MIEACKVVQLILDEDIVTRNVSIDQAEVCGVRGVLQDRVRHLAHVSRPSLARIYILFYFKFVFSDGAHNVQQGASKRLPTWNMGVMPVPPASMPATYAK